jgi:hypothetical protein
MGLISDFWDTLKQVFTRPPYESPCHGDCNQGRNCDCERELDLQAQRKHQLQDEFNNANWPFPVNKP